jgi:hypothetical protein
MRTVLSSISVHLTVGTGRPPEAMINDCFPAPNLMAWNSAVSSKADVRHRGYPMAWTLSGTKLMALLIRYASNRITSSNCFLFREGIAAQSCSSSAVSFDRA